MVPRVRRHPRNILGFFRVTCSIWRGAGSRARDDRRRYQWLSRSRARQQASDLCLVLNCFLADFPEARTAQRLVRMLEREVRRIKAGANALA